MLKRLGVSNNNLVLLNEHTEESVSGEIIQQLLTGKNVAVVF
jgi:16S rRNA C1402 (ribose-2'-O) methylase RsmI